MIPRLRQRKHNLEQLFIYTCGSYFTKVCLNIFKYVYI